MSSLVWRIQRSVASAKKDEASRLFKIAQRTCDDLESHVDLDLYGKALRSIGNSVLCHFERLLFKQRHSRATDSHRTDSQVVDHASSKNASEDGATESGIMNLSRNDLDEISRAFYEATKSFLEGKREEEEREREEEGIGMDEEDPQGRQLARHDSMPRDLVAALNDINTNVNKYLDSLIPPEQEQLDCSLEVESSLDQF